MGGNPRAVRPGGGKGRKRRKRWERGGGKDAAHALHQVFMDERNATGLYFETLDTVGHASYRPWSVEDGFRRIRARRVRAARKGISAP